MSCDSKQRQIAQAAGVSGGISPGGSKSAGVAGQVGQVGGVTPKASPRSGKKPRKVRQAVKAYQKLPAARKEKLWEAVGQAALENDSKRQRQLLGTAAREFGAGVVAAAVADEQQRAKKDGDDWGLKRYQTLAKTLPELKQPAKAAAKPKKVAQPPGVTSGAKKAAGETLPTQHQVVLGDAFSAKELNQLQNTALLSSAATRRQLEARRLNAGRGHLHSDPRAQDWMTQDLNNFRFLSRQLGEARRNGGKLDTAALDEAELLDLWEFSRFEADRALRNVDHLLSGWSHLKGETADYLGGQLRLEARFYSHLAQQLEPRITPDLRDKYESWEVG